MPTGAVDDFAAESDTLYGLLHDRADALERVTPFAGWRSLDCLVHIAFGNRMVALLLTDEEAYRAELARISTTEPRPRSAHEIYAVMSRRQHDRIDASDPRRLVERWRSDVDELCVLLAERAADEQVTWYGRPMSLDRLVAARQMETWAYGQDIFDAFRTRRRERDRIRNVADFGVRTFRFSFANNHLEVPGPVPHVSLRGPSGARWQWGEAQAHESVSGDAVEFCLVVTQRRHVADTTLDVVGPTATAWMKVAQTIAAPPMPPMPGARVWRDQQ